MRPRSSSPRPGQAASLILLLTLASPAIAQERSNAPQPPKAPIAAPRAAPLRAACPPGSTRPSCQARRATVAPASPPASVPLGRTDDIGGTRFVPPAIQTLLADRRIAPTTRYVLRHLAAKPTEDWTLGELQLVQQLVPTLSEMSIPTRTLSDFYEFLGLDPTSLFEPRLGNSATGTGFDRRNYEAVQQAQCLYLLGYGENIDPSAVTLKDLAACSPGD